MKEKTNLLYRTIGSNISALRRSKKFGQQKLAELTSISRSSLANIEIGNQQPSIFTIYEIAVALECEINDILPSKEVYVSSSSIEEEYADIFSSLKTSEKNIRIFKRLLKKN